LKPEKNFNDEKRKNAGKKSVNSLEICEVVAI